MNIFRGTISFAIGAVLGLGVWAYSSNQLQKISGQFASTTSAPISNHSYHGCANYSANYIGSRQFSDQSSMTVVQSQVEKLSQGYVPSFVPTSMKAGVQKIVEFRIPSEIKAQILDIASGYVTIKLDADSSRFKTQLFGNEKHNISDDEPWRWQITPLKQGSSRLTISASTEVTPKSQLSTQIPQNSNSSTAQDLINRILPYRDPWPLLPPPPFLLPQAPPLVPQTQSTPQTFCTFLFDDEIQVQRNWGYSIGQFWQQNYREILQYTIPSGLLFLAITAVINNQKPNSGTNRR